ncbi:L,D-transpeptidase family protein [Maricaulis maris]|uniref:Murein L,D-transpeptidase YcbB/YkuD n=1 Tax=Maricaulis maris TaxID=74318 RepID=A0A495D4B1_9PROT|nr:L,D-transpeptidase family protein [Maricaulis maris]RKQ95351.1 murein L,D-transpeptidase YcbB/YkuD [Maricaulis maris]
MTQHRSFTTIFVGVIVGILLVLSSALSGAMAAAMQDVVVPGSDTAGETPVEVVPLTPARPLADLDLWASRINGWTEAHREAISVRLFDASSHGLPDLDPFARAILDPARPESERNHLAGLAYLRFAGWLEYGLIDAETHAPRRLFDSEASLLVRRLGWAFEAGDAAQALDDSVPQVRDYDALRLEMMRVLAVTPIWAGIESGPSLSLGDSGPRVDQLRTRLTSEGLLDTVWRDGDPFDLRLETAVRRYQGRANLAPSGRLDQATLRQLNLPPNRRIGQLMANLEQRRWRTRELGRRHIWVNLADFRLEAWENGELVREHEVMVGRQASSTPEFSEDMQYIVLNPWWGLPAGSARPRFQSFRRNPGLVRQHGFRIYNRAGEPVSVYEIDWSRWGNDWPYRMSQPPGPTNPMGEVKFIFPNRHNVYIHDTTERDQFVRTRRDFSAGCIRVRDPLALASWVLAGQAGWDRDRIDAVTAGSSPTVVWLDERIPVHIAYWTVVGDGEGRVRYLNDLYRRDGSVIDAYLAAYESGSGLALPVSRGSAGPVAASFD